MKLYDCPRDSIIHIIDEVTYPIANGTSETTLKFHHIDGMYSYCTTIDGDVVHPAAWTEVEIVGKWETHGTKTL